MVPEKGDGNRVSGEPSALGGTRKSSLSLFFSRKFEKLINKIYRVSYYVGIQFIRTMKRYKRIIKYYAANNSITHFFKIKNVRERMRGYVKELCHDMFSPFMNIAKKFERVKKNVAAKAEHGFFPAAGEVFRSIGKGCKEVFSALYHLSSYVAPVLGILFLVATVRLFSGLTYGLEVEYGGKTLGYIKTEADFQKAEKMMQQRIVYGEGEEPIYTIPTYKVTVVDQSEFTPTTTICDGIIKASGSEIVEAAGIYVDDKFCGATNNKEAVSATLNSLLDSSRTGALDEKVTFAQDVKLVDGLYPVTTVEDAAELATVLTSQVEGERTYTVEAGDSAWSIAQKMDVSVSDLLLNNPGMDKKLLPGQDIIVAKAQPFLPIKTTQTVVYEDTLPYNVVQNKTNKKNVGYTVITKKGKSGTQEITAQVTMVDGIQTEKTVLSRRVIEEAVDEQVTVGTKPLPIVNSGQSAPTYATGKFMWPVVGGGSISCGINGYRGHTGTDIVLAYGAKIVAADSGQVVTAKKTSGGYGNHVMISHGNGVYTLYGHLSKRYVSVGEYVNKGDVIGLMGRTGNVTGTHLHFEVRVNGRYMNPMKYF